MVKLRSMLAVPMAVIMLITLALVAFLSAGAIRNWQDGQQALARMEQLRHLLMLQEMLGLERGPGNTVLSMHAIVSPAYAAMFAERRRATDQQLHELATLPGLSGPVGAILAELSIHLAVVRTSVDLVIQQPPEQRSADASIAAVAAQMSLPPMLFPAVELTLAEISAIDPAIAPLLTAVHAASDLRLYAGSIISKFAAAIVKGTSYTMRDLGAIRVQQGQVIELHRLLLASINLANLGDQTRDVVATMEQQYFGSAQQLVDQQIAIAADTGHFTLTHAEFLAVYEPVLQVFVAVRDRVLTLTRRTMRADQAARLQRLEMTAVAGSGVLLAMLAALLMLHRWIIRPLADLAAMVIRLANGDRAVHLVARRGSREIAELVDAIEVLRVATIEADAAAARRHTELQRWTAQLHQVLDTIDLLQTRAATITDVLPILLDQLAMLGRDDDAAMPGLTAAIVATRGGMTVLQSATLQLDSALLQMHFVSGDANVCIDTLTAAMDEVARVVAQIQDAVNELPQITLGAICELSARTGRSGPRRAGPNVAVHERILVQVQEMAAASGGLQSALKQATHGLGALTQLRA